MALFGNIVARLSEEEKRSQINHKTISSILIMLFTVETHNDSGGVVAVFQHNGMSCRAADRKKQRMPLFCDAIDPGSIERKEIVGVDV